MFKLGTVVRDSVTGLKGMLTHLQLEGDGPMYLFQPHGLNPKTQEPVDEFWIAPNRVLKGQQIREPYLARDVLGTEVEDAGSGFKGIAVAVVLHINGCIHIDVQPPGRVAETGARIKRHNFDIRRLKGNAIKPMSEVERAVDEQRRPSPAAFVRLRD